MIRLTLKKPCEPIYGFLDWCWRRKKLTLVAGSASLAIASLAGVALLALQQLIGLDSITFQAASPIPQLEEVLRNERLQVVFIALFLAIWLSLISVSHLVVSVMLRSYLLKREISLRPSFGQELIVERELTEKYLQTIILAVRFILFTLLLGIALSWPSQFGLAFCFAQASWIAVRRWNLGFSNSEKLQRASKSLKRDVTHANRVTLIELLHVRDAKIGRVTVAQVALFTVLLVGLVILPSEVFGNKPINSYFLLLLVWIQTFLAMTTDSSSLGRLWQRLCGILSKNAEGLKGQ